MAQADARPAEDHGPALRRSFPAALESVSHARGAVGGLATGLGADRLLLGDIQLAVTEAVTNAVLHAYAEAGEDAVVEIDAWAQQARLRVVVRDYGCGLVPDSASAGLGLGLGLIALLADDVHLRGQPPAVGTEVDMVFDMARPVPGLAT